MTPLFISVIISCSQAIEILNRVTSVSGLTLRQRIEIVQELKTLVPSCPVTIKKDEHKQK
jgi:hypothetical protein